MNVDAAIVTNLFSLISPVERESEASQQANAAAIETLLQDMTPAECNALLSTAHEGSPSFFHQAADKPAYLALLFRYCTLETDALFELLEQKCGPFSSVFCLAAKQAGSLAVLLNDNRLNSAQLLAGLAQRYWPENSGLHTAASNPETLTLLLSTQKIDRERLIEALTTAERGNVSAFFGASVVPECLKQFIAALTKEELVSALAVGPEGLKNVLIHLVTNPDSLELLLTNEDFTGEELTKLLCSKDPSGLCALHGLARNPLSLSRVLKEPRLAKAKLIRAICRAEETMGVTPLSMAFSSPESAQQMIAYLTENSVNITRELTKKNCFRATPVQVSIAKSDNLRALMRALPTELQLFSVLVENVFNVNSI